ncbi:MAG: hypothetical protein QM811_25810 [Pirellulales bacterium]
MNASEAKFCNACGAAIDDHVPGAAGSAAALGPDAVRNPFRPGRAADPRRA